MELFSEGAAEMESYFNFCNVLLLIHFNDFNAKMCTSFRKTLFVRTGNICRSILFSKFQTSVMQMMCCLQIMHSSQFQNMYATSLLKLSV